MLESGCELHGARPEADDEDVAFGSEAAAHDRNEVPGGDAEGDEEDPACGDEDAEEGAAQWGFELQADDENEEGEGAVADLSEGIAEDDADAVGIELAVDVQPVAGSNPGEQAIREDEGFGFGLDEEAVIEVEPLANAVGGFEGCGGEEEVG